MIFLLLFLFAINEQELVSLFEKSKKSTPKDTHCLADSAEIDFNDMRASFSDFSGSLPFKAFKDDPKLFFQSQKATIDKERHCLYLWNDVSLFHHPFFLLSVDRLSIYQKEDHHFFMQGGDRVKIHLQDKKDLFLEGDEINWQSAEEKITIYGAPVQLQDDLCHIYCKKAALFYHKEDLFPERVVLSDKIQLFYNEKKLKSYGIAEKITYDPTTKELLLEGKRVLFCNEEDNLRISAPKILIKKDHYVKGIGDVRFSFNQEEKEKFNTLFSKYLHLR